MFLVIDENMRLCLCMCANIGDLLICSFYLQSRSNEPRDLSRVTTPTMNLEFLEKISGQLLNNQHYLQLLTNFKDKYIVGCRGASQLGGSLLGDPTRV